jgi:hypothetical protein
MLAKGLDYAFGLLSFGRCLGIIRVIWVDRAISVGVRSIFKKMVNAMGLCNRERESKQRGKRQRRTPQQEAARARTHCVSS